jgi:hypothetical protein
MQQRHGATHLECWSGTAALSLSLYVDGTAISDIPCALRDSHERKNRETEREVDEDETDFENERRACHSVMRDGICCDGDTCGSGGLG